MPEALDLGWNWFPAIGGVALVAIFLKLVGLFWRRRRTWTETDATVGKVRVREASASGGDGGIFVNYHFTDHTGQQRMGTDSPWFRKPRRKSILRVRYDPASPEMSEIVTPLWGEVVIILGGVAAGVLLVFIAVIGS